ncbi:MAG TPA: enolase C-terminal domain-like protein [Ramlibacter sp.]|jgi:L-alanine-DL-glutamate epimerase-like enolase superfamily enzyme|nr:enolase C-terminal domain-like protein [Ramlibacter sp.]
MAEAPLVSIRAIELLERPVTLRMPFRFGVVTLREAPQAFARVQVGLPDGRTAWGAGAELMAPKWFDKDLALSNEDNFEQLRAVLRLAREAYLSDRSPATAFGHFARHHDAHAAEAARLGFNPLLSAYGPALLDRAVLDAVCRAQGLSFYAAMQGNLPGVGALHSQFAGFDFDAFLASLRPAERIHARHTVGLVDAITASDQTEHAGDGLPETLEEVVQAYGHRYFKLKVAGKVDADLARLEAIASVLDRSGEPYQASLDGNEQYDSGEGVQALVRGIAGRPALRRLWDSIVFIEQPIARKLALEVDLRAAPLGKPVIVDESDGELQSFVQARARGYAGVSSKTCKGFYKSVLNAARCVQWNREEGTPRYFMSGEDLTTQAGLSVQQDIALVNLLGITHVERNGHHYVDGMKALPRDEQQAFLAAHPDVYEDSHGAVRLRIRGGEIAIGSLGCTGFASGAMPSFEAMARIA